MLTFLIYPPRWEALAICVLRRSQSGSSNRRSRRNARGGQSLGLHDDVIGHINGIPYRWKLHCFVILFSHLCRHQHVSYVVPAEVLELLEDIDILFFLRVEAKRRISRVWWQERMRRLSLTFSSLAFMSAMSAGLSKTCCLFKGGGIDFAMTSSQLHAAWAAFTSSCMLYSCDERCKSP